MYITGDGNLAPHSVKAGKLPPLENPSSPCIQPVKLYVLARRPWLHRIDKAGPFKNQVLLLFDPMCPPQVGQLERSFQRWQALPETSNDRFKLRDEIETNCESAALSVRPLV